MIAIVVLVLFALWRGIDGYIYGLAIAALAGLGGYNIKDYLVKKKSKEDKNNGTGVSGT